MTQHENVVVFVTDAIPHDAESVDLSFVPSSMRIIPTGIGKRVAESLRHIEISPNATISVKNHRNLFVQINMKQLVENICPARNFGN